LLHLTLLGLFHRTSPDEPRRQIAAAPTSWPTRYGSATAVYKT
jgi:hypothetical protein